MNGNSNNIKCNLLNFANSEMDNFMNNLQDEFSFKYSKDLMFLAAKITLCNPKLFKYWSNKMNPIDTTNKLEQIFMECDEQPKVTFPRAWVIKFDEDKFFNEESRYKMSSLAGATRYSSRQKAKIGFRKSMKEEYHNRKYFKNHQYVEINK